MENSSINLAALDFDTLKQNFKSYLQKQSTFKDYNFEGSNINVLLDVLAYNSYLNSFYLNMIASEMFLDTAQKLDSVVSHAKELNYLPRSNRSSKAVINFSVDTTGVVNPFTIPKGVLISGTNSNGNYTFTTKEKRSFISTNTVYTIEELEIYEGFYLTDTFIVDYGYENQKFVLSTPTVDTTDIDVTVSENNGETNTTFTFAENLYGVASNSTVYFIQATGEAKYEIVFGDNVFGRRPQNGAVVYVEYRVSEGSDSNGVSSFNIDEDLGKINNGVGVYSDVQVVANSAYGANSEGIESIRYNAPRHYQTQSRCITTNDFSTTVLQNFPEIQYVNVYGGEITNTAVEYGYVYIAPSTYSGILLTTNRKKDIELYINKLCTVGITAKIVDPEYLYVKINSKIHVNFKNTKSSSAVLITKAIAAVKNYNQNSLQNFNTAFRMSKLQQKINDSDIGILSNETTSSIFRLYSPPLNVPYAISANLDNPIVKGSITSSSFISYGKSYVFTDYIKGVDEGNGVLYKIEQNADLTNTNYTAVGVVDYISGIINVNQIQYSNINGGLSIEATCLNQDIYCYKNTIIEIDTVNGLTFNVVEK